MKYTEKEYTKSYRRKEKKRQAFKQKIGLLKTKKKAFRKRRQIWKRTGITRKEEDKFSIKILKFKMESRMRLRVARTVREEGSGRKAGSRLIIANDWCTRYGVCALFSVILFCLNCNRLILLERIKHTVLSLGGNLKTNIACTEKAKRFPTQVGRFKLMLTLMVKVILLEFQFLDPSHVGVCLVGYKAYLLDVRYGNAIGHSSQKNRMAISHFKGMSGVPKRVTGQDVRNTGWSKALLMGYDHRVFIVTKYPIIRRNKSLPNSRDIVKGGSQHGYTGGRYVPGRWTSIHKFCTRFYSTQIFFLEDGWKKRATIPEEFVTFQKKCVDWKGPIKDYIYKFLLDPRLFQIAYGKLRSNLGYMTPGINPTTLDGLSEEWIQETIALFKNETFKFTPGRRVNIAKPQGGTRQLTIASPRDKIVMEVMRMVLEAVFEPRFSSHSHGFRSGRSCHTALKQVREQFGVASWYIEGDISKCFDSINHHKLMAVIESVIKDRKFTRLIWKTLRTGYFEFREYQTSLIGTPQGSVISPILANIYMHQFDLYIEELKKQYDKGSRTRGVNAYKNLNWLINKKDSLLSKEDKRKLAIKMRLIPSRDPMDPNFRRLLYVRYADDWIIGIRGTHSETVYIKTQIEEFLKGKMELDLNKEKTLITHTVTGKALFLGTYIFKSRVQRHRRSDKNRIIRNSREVRLEAPIKRIVSKLTKASYVKNGVSWPKFIWLHCSLEQIVRQYNSVLRGYMNYYSFVDNRGAMATYIYYLLRGSCAKLIAAKMKLGSQLKVYAIYGKSLTVDKVSGLGLQKPSYVVRPWAFHTDHVSYHVNLFKRSISPASVLGLACSLCGGEYRVEMHHIRQLKDIKAGKSFIDEIMIRHKRKQIPLCRKCHMEVHRRKVF
jgi:group II intron reverse transcriptase/maturase